MCEQHHSTIYSSVDVYKRQLHKYETEGLERLCAELKLLDPEYYKIVDLKNPKRVIHALEIDVYKRQTQASIILVNKDFVPEQEIKATLIKVDNAYESLAKLLNLYEQSKPKHPFRF